jgi:hypothetical protein
VATSSSGRGYGDSLRTPACPPPRGSTTTQVGGSLGLAVLATAATSRTDHLMAAGQSTAVALTGGHQLAFVIAAASETAISEEAA